MAIKPPPIKAPPPILADWVELRTIADPRNRYRLSQLKRFWDTHRETEDSDPWGLRRTEDDTDQEGAAGEDDDAFLASISDELAERADALKGAYPFVLDNEQFRLKEEISESGYIYLFCLLITHWSEGEILDGSWTPTITPHVRDLFQACSTIAAAGFVSGCSISFGWPRPGNNPPFLQKLTEVYGIFGEGTVVAVRPAGVSPFAKDEEIDVIAWRPSPTPNTLYLLGQVASGDNWASKSIKGGSIDYFHGAWFNPGPVSEAMASIFIPAFIEEYYDGTRKERLTLLTTKYGKIFDRMSLPAYAEEGLQLADIPGQTLTIERRADIPQIADWVRDMQTGLHAVGCALI